MSNDSNNCVILDDDEEEQTNSKPVNNAEPNTNLVDDGSYCADITGS